MPTCRECQAPYPSRIVVDGCTKNLGNRSICLTCLPFKHKQTRRLIGEKSICGCGRSYIYDKSAGHTKTKCNSCNANARRSESKLRALTYKGGCCEQCGYKRCPAALGFHHTNPKTKLFTIAGSYGRSWDMIRAELDKCLLLCANCHAEEHDRVSKLPIV